MSRVSVLRSIGNDSITRNGMIYNFRFHFSIVDKEFLGKPEEDAETKSISIDVGLSHKQKHASGLEDCDFCHLLFEYGKRRIVQDIKDGTLAEYQSIVIPSIFRENGYLFFDVKRIKDPGDYVEDIEIPDTQIASDVGEIQLASQIISERDNINALFRQRYDSTLLKLPEERCLLELFRPANSNEDFMYRLAGLSVMITGMNTDILRKNTECHDATVQSLKLLGLFIEKNFPKSQNKSVEIFQNINRIRKGYPVHGDYKDVINSYQYFGIEYPITDHNSAWRVLMLQYYNALENLRRLIQCSISE